MTGLHMPRLPDTITTTQVADAYTALGLDPDTVRAVHLQPAYVVAEAYLHDTDGQRVPLGSMWRTEVVTIPRVR